MNWRKYGFLLPLAMLAGCDMTVEVTGLLGGTEKLTGSLTHYSDGGTMELFGGPKTHCVGNFTYTKSMSGPEGNGMLMCDDRRTGPFRFQLRGMKHGVGWGTLGTQRYSFSF